jgi:hypothetical protein
VIKSYSFSQNEILQDIIDLHTGPIEADFTYGSGCFYKNGVVRPAFCFDVDPRRGVTQADVRYLPLKEASIGCGMFDPPFRIKTGPGSNISSRYGSITGGMPGLRLLYSMALHELYRVLRPKGWLIFKCQDMVSGGKNHFNHCHVWVMASHLGFEAVDLLLLTATRRQEDPQGRAQKHARKYHSYFWVFKKH